MNIKCNKYEFPFSETNDVRIVQVSDLHNHAFKRNELIECISLMEPDIIAVTGDFLDRHRPKSREETISFFTSAVKLCPIYCIEGNHERALRNVIDWNSFVSDLGAIALDNSFSDIEVKNSRIRLVGLSETFCTDDAALMQSVERYTITLSHRPERIGLYELMKCNLVLCGHAHGGQIRIFGHGLFAPEQGVLPKYTRGEYKLNNTTMLVSAGLGNTICVPRIFNPYEVNLITLKSVNQ